MWAPGGHLFLLPCLLFIFKTDVSSTFRSRSRSRRCSHTAPAAAVLVQELALLVLVLGAGASSSSSMNAKDAPLHLDHVLEKEVEIPDHNTMVNPDFYLHRRESCFNEDDGDCVSVSDNVKNGYLTLEGHFFRSGRPRPDTNSCHSNSWGSNTWPFFSLIRFSGLCGLHPGRFQNVTDLEAQLQNLRVPESMRPDFRYRGPTTTTTTTPPAWQKCVPYSRDACRAAAVAMGKTAGGCGYTFAWPDFWAGTPYGCIGYQYLDDDYYGTNPLVDCVYFVTTGTLADKQPPLVDVDEDYYYRPLGYDCNFDVNATSTTTTSTTHTTITTTTHGNIHNIGMNATSTVVDKTSTSSCKATTTTSNNHDQHDTKDHVVHELAEFPFILSRLWSTSSMFVTMLAEIVAREHHLVDTYHRTVRFGTGQIELVSECRQAEDSLDVICDNNMPRVTSMMDLEIMQSSLSDQILRKRTASELTVARNGYVVNWGMYIAERLRKEVLQKYGMDLSWYRQLDAFAEFHGEEIVKVFGNTTDVYWAECKDQTPDVLERYGFGACVDGWWIPPICGGPPDANPSKFPQLSSRSFFPNDNESNYSSATNNTSPMSAGSSIIKINTPDTCIPFAMRPPSAMRMELITLLQQIRTLNLRIKVTFTWQIHTWDAWNEERSPLWASVSPSPDFAKWAENSFLGKGGLTRVQLPRHSYENYFLRDPPLFDTDTDPYARKAMWPALRQIAPQLARFYDDFRVGNAEMEEAMSSLHERGFDHWDTRDGILFDYACEFLKKPENTWLWNKTMCEDGHFLKRDNLTHDTCVPCPKGKTLAYDAYTQPYSKCQECERGKHAPEAGMPACVSCPLGTISSADRKSCEPCPPGMTSTRKSQQLNLCEKCPEGTHAAREGMPKCEPCPSNSTSIASRVSCAPCPLGAVYSDGACRCKQGYRQQEEVVRSSSSASRTNSEVEETEDEDGGKNEELVCVPCPRHHYKSTIGNTDVCIPCEDGFIAPTNGSALCDLCPLGSYITWSVEEKMKLKNNRTDPITKEARESVSGCRSCANDEFVLAPASGSAAPVTLPGVPKSIAFCVCAQNTHVLTNWSAHPASAVEISSSDHFCEVTWTKNANTLQPAVFAKIENRNEPLHVVHPDAPSSRISTVQDEGTCGGPLLEDNFKNLYRRQNMTCSACPAEIICDWGTTALMGAHLQVDQQVSLGRTRDGFVVLGRTVREDNSRYAYRCLWKKACPAAPISARRDSCPIGASGIGCSNCDPGYFYNGFACEECGEYAGGALSWILFLLGGAVAFLLFYYQTCPRLDHSTFSPLEVHLRVRNARFGTTVALFIHQVGTLWIIQKLAPIQNPLPNALLHGPGAILLQLNGIENASCMGHQSLPNPDDNQATSTAEEESARAAVWKTISFNLLPLLLFVCLLLCKAMARLIRAYPRWLYWGEKYVPDMGYGVAFLLMAFEVCFMFIASNAISIGFSTYPHPRLPDGSEVESLRFQPSLLKDSGHALGIRMICAVATLIYCGGYVATMALLFWYVSQRGPYHLVTNRDVLEFVNKLMLPHLARFKDEYYAWALVLLFKRFVPVLIETLVQSLRWRLNFMGLFLTADIVMSVAFVQAFRFRRLELVALVTTTVHAAIVLIIASHAPSFDGGEHTETVILSEQAEYLTVVLVTLCYGVTAVWTWPYLTDKLFIQDLNSVTDALYNEPHQLADKSAKKTTNKKNEPTSSGTKTLAPKQTTSFEKQKEREAEMLQRVCMQQYTPGMFDHVYWTLHALSKNRIAAEKGQKSRALGVNFARHGRGNRHKMNTKIAALVKTPSVPANIMASTGLHGEEPSVNNALLNLNPTLPFVNSETAPRRMSLTARAEGEAEPPPTTTLGPDGDVLVLQAGTASSPFLTPNHACAQKTRVDGPKVLCEKIVEGSAGAEESLPTGGPALIMSDPVDVEGAHHSVSSNEDDAVRADGQTEIISNAKRGAGHDEVIHPGGDHDSTTDINVESNNLNTMSNLQLDKNCQQHQPRTSALRQGPSSPSNKNYNGNNVVHTVNTNNSNLNSMMSLNRSVAFELGLVDEEAIEENEEADEDSDIGMAAGNANGQHHGVRGSGAAVAALLSDGGFGQMNPTRKTLRGQSVADQLSQFDEEMVLRTTQLFVETMNDSTAQLLKKLIRELAVAKEAVQRIVMRERRHRDSLFDKTAEHLGIFGNFFPVSHDGRGGGGGPERKGEGDGRGASGSDPHEDIKPSTKNEKTGLLRRTISPLQMEAAFAKSNLKQTRQITMLGIVGDAERFWRNRRLEQKLHTALHTRQTQVLVTTSTHAANDTTTSTPVEILPQVVGFGSRGGPAPGGSTSVSARSAHPARHKSSTAGSTLLRGTTGDALADQRLSHRGRNPNSANITLNDFFPRLNTIVDERATASLELKDDEEQHQLRAAKKGKSARVLADTDQESETDRWEYDPVPEGELVHDAQEGRLTAIKSKTAEGAKGPKIEVTEGP